MDSVLLYETEDSDFADSAIEALERAHIACYRTGGRLSVGRSDPTVCIHIRDRGDYQRANAILIELGAAIERPFRIPTSHAAKLGAGIAIVLLIWLLTWLVSGRPT